MADSSSTDTSSPEISEITGTIVNSFTTEIVTKKRLKRSKVSKTSSCSAVDRAKSFNNPNFYADGEVLFCRVCSKAVDHRRENSLKRHLETSLHQNNKKIQGRSTKQKTLETTFAVPTEARLENLKTVCCFVKTLAASKIPFNVVENEFMRKFFKDFVRGGGAIPKSKALLEYLEDIYKVITHHEPCHSRFSGKLPSDR